MSTLAAAVLLCSASCGGGHAKGTLPTQPPRASASAATSARPLEPPAPCPPVVNDASPRSVMVPQVGPKAGSAVLAWHPSGSVFATVHEGGSLAIWDGHTAELRGNLLGHTGVVNDIAFHPAAPFVVSVGADAKVHAWDARSGEALPDKVLRVAGVTARFSSDGALLAIQLVSTTVEILDGATREPRRQLRDASAFEWSPDGRTIATLAPAKTEWSIRDAATDTVRFKMKAGNPNAKAFAWSPDGKTIASAEDDKIALRDAATGAVVGALDVGARPTTIVWSPDGARLALLDGSVQLWDTGTRARAHDLGAGSAISWSRDGGRIAIVGRGEARVHDARSGAAISTATWRGFASIARLAFSPTEDAVAGIATTDGGGGVAFVGDVQTGSTRKTSRPALEFERVRALAWSPDGARLVAVNSREKGANAWDMRTGSVEKLLARGPASHPEDVVLENLAHARWSPRGTFLALGGLRGFALWDGRTLAPLRRVRQSDTNEQGIAWSPDESELATTGALEVRIWDPKTGRRVRSIPLPRAPRAIAWGSDVLAVSTSSTILFFDPKTGTQRDKVEMTSFVNDLAFGPRGIALAVATAGGTLQILDGRTGKVAEDLVGHERAVKAVAWSADGASLASGSDDGTLRIWDTRTGRSTTSVTGGDPVEAVAFSPDGAVVAIARGRAELVRASDAQRLALQVIATGERVSGLALAEGGAFGGDDAARSFLRFRAGGVIDGKLTTEGPADMRRARIVADLLRGCPLK